MSVDNRNPDGTFKKGFTANRRGAPRKAKRRYPALASDILSDPAFNPLPGYLPQGLLPEHEAAWLTLLAAMKDNKKRARRLLLKHILRRDTERIRLAQLEGPKHRVEKLIEPHDPDNVDEALLILGIVSEDKNAVHHHDKRRRLKLLPWAVQSALGRRHGGQRLSATEIEEIKFFTVDPHKLRWSRRYGDSGRGDR